MCVCLAVGSDSEAEDPRGPKLLVMSFADPTLVNEVRQGRTRFCGKRSFLQSDVNHSIMNLGHGYSLLGHTCLSHEGVPLLVMAHIIASEDEECFTAALSNLNLIYETEPLAQGVVRVCDSHWPPLLPRLTMAMLHSSGHPHVNITLSLEQHRRQMEGWEMLQLR